jgi:NAD(P)-dependent dehydrogenase (short-subunit alcohol dehydrogenase family)
MNRLDGKVALVTGGAMGIGRAASRLLASEGARVALIDLNDEEGRAAVAEIESEGGVARYWHMDVTREKEVEVVFADVVQVYGRIDTLVNNAGISGVDKPTHEITEEEWDQVMAVNVKGVFLCTKHVIRHMRRTGGGSIVNLSSIYGLIGNSDIPPYHASKGAVRLMSKNDALIYAKDGVRVNSVHPGFIWTPLVEELGKRSPLGVSAFRKQLDDLHPIGHVGKPEDVAYGVLYLASDEACFVTGSELVIDGGYTAR